MGFPTPGPPLPGQAQALYDHIVVGNEAADISTTATTTLSNVVADEVQIEEVVVNPDSAGFDFNVSLDGNDVFSGEQSPAAASEESFTPDQNDRVDGVDAARIQFDVSSADTGTAEVYVKVKTRVNS